MANPGHRLRRERPSPATAEALRIEGLRNSGIGPARRQGGNGLDDLWGCPHPLGGSHPWYCQVSRGSSMPQELDPRLTLGRLDWGQGDLFDQQP